MGPRALFDKSFIQSLNIDESVWFDRFFRALIAPVFYVETLADLAKGASKRASAESEVRFIASKFPDCNSYILMNYHELCIGDLLGYEVPMDGRIPTRGRNIKSGNQFGLIVDPYPEVDAFHRWQKEEFYEIERVHANEWRNELNSLDLNKIKEELNKMGVGNDNFKTLDAIKKISDEIVSLNDRSVERLNLINLFFNIPTALQKKIFERWTNLGCPAISTFAPYAAFVLTIELFFQLGLGTDLISAQRNSNRIDISYLFYLPFTEIFISSDKLHKKCAPLFLSKNQQFIWGKDLKDDLQKLDSHYKTLPEHIKSQSLMKFAEEPPVLGNYLTSKIWDEYGLRHDEPIELSHDQEEDIVEQFDKLFNGAEISSMENITSSDYLILKRMIKKRKGSWNQLPEDCGESKSKSVVDAHS